MCMVPDCMDGSRITDESLRRLFRYWDEKRGGRPSALRDQLKSRGILICAGSMSGLAEEAPASYKDVAQVVDVVHKLGIGRKIARLEPVAVIKG